VSKPGVGEIIGKGQHSALNLHHGQAAVDRIQIVPDHDAVTAAIERTDARQQQRAFVFSGQSNAIAVSTDT
jgi:hypothetical protein